MSILETPPPPNTRPASPMLWAEFREPGWKIHSTVLTSLLPASLAPHHGLGINWVNQSTFGDMEPSAPWLLQAGIGWKGLVSPCFEILMASTCRRGMLWSPEQLEITSRKFHPGLPQFSAASWRLWATALQTFLRQCVFPGLWVSLSSAQPLLPA